MLGTGENISVLLFTKECSLNRITRTRYNAFSKRTQETFQWRYALINLINKFRGLNRVITIFRALENIYDEAFLRKTIVGPPPSFIKWGAGFKFPKFPKRGVHIFSIKREGY